MCMPYRRIISTTFYNISFTSEFLEYLEFDYMNIWFPDPINIFQSSYSTDSSPIRISYHRNTHYNSVRDPYKATVGVGLGLPGYKPGVSWCNVYNMLHKIEYRTLTI